VRRLLWFGVLGAPFAWASQLVLGYGIEEAACSSGTASSGFWELGRESLIFGVSLAAALVALAAGLVAAANLRAARDGERGQLAFLAAAGTLGSILFLGTILLAGASLATLDPCAAG
jgi:hypothetical protein